MNQFGISACQKNDALLRRLASEGCCLAEIGRQVGTKGSLVKAYLLKHQIPYTPFRPTLANNARWKGGRRIEDGYVMLKNWNHPHCNRHGYVREHRVVMEKVLGRYLLTTEVVHHRDGDTLNNDPANLFVYGSNAQHLAETLKGKVPKWTEAGWEGMRAPRPHRRGPKQKSIPDPSTQDAAP